MFSHLLFVMVSSTGLFKIKMPIVDLDDDTLATSIKLCLFNGTLISASLLHKIFQ